MPTVFKQVCICSCKIAVKRLRTEWHLVCRAQAARITAPAGTAVSDADAAVYIRVAMATTKAALMLSS